MAKKSGWEKAGSVFSALSTAFSLGKAIATVVGMFNHKQWYQNAGPVQSRINFQIPIGVQFNDQSLNEPFLTGAQPIVTTRFAHDLTGNAALHENSRALFQELRSKLRTNLLYDLNEVEGFLQESIAFQAVCAQVSRDIRLRSYFQKRMPNVNNLLIQKPAGWNELALTADVEVKEYLKSTDYAETLALLRTLAAKSETIIKLGDINEYFGWMFGFLFKDEKTMAGQIYVNDLNKVVCKYFGEFDPQTVSLNQLIQWAEFINTTYSVVMADLVHAGYNAPVMVPTDAVGLPPIVVDVSQFNALINAYVGENLPDRIRIDSMRDKDALEPEEVVSMLMLTENVSDDDGLGLKTNFLRPVDQYVIIDGGNADMYRMTGSNVYASAAWNNNTNSITLLPPDYVRGLLAIKVAPLPTITSSIDVTALSATSQASNVITSLGQLANERLNIISALGSQVFIDMASPINNSVIGTVTLGQTLGAANLTNLNTTQVYPCRVWIPLVSVINPTGVSGGNGFVYGVNVTGSLKASSLNQFNSIGLTVGGAGAEYTFGYRTPPRRLTDTQLRMGVQVIECPSLVANNQTQTTNYLGQFTPITGVTVVKGTEQEIAIFSVSNFNGGQFGGPVSQNVLKAPDMSFTYDLTAIAGFSPSTSVIETGNYLYQSNVVNVPYTLRVPITATTAAQFATLVNVGGSSVTQWARMMADYRLPCVLREVTKLTVSNDGTVSTQEVENELSLLKELYDPGLASRMDICAIRYAAQLSLFGFVSIASEKFGAKKEAGTWSKQSKGKGYKSKPSTESK